MKQLLVGVAIIGAGTAGMHTAGRFAFGHGFIVTRLVVEPQRS